MDARPTITAKPGFRARLARELKRLCIVALIGSAAVITAKFWGFSRLDEEIRARVENRLREHYQGLDVHVRYARRLEGQGIEIRGVTIAEVGGGAAPILVSIEEIFAECDTHFPDFITQTPKIRQTHVRGMKLRAQRHASGFWNLSHLLPLPMTKGEPCPATITDATLEIIDPSQSSKPLTLRNLELSVAPQVVPQIKYLIRRVKMSEAKTVATAALAAETSREVLELSQKLVRSVAPSLFED